MREALDEESKRLGRYVQLTNYSSGLCMPEIAFMAAYERLDMLLNDAMYGILFRDINMRRTFCDQYFSRRICAFAEIIINTGEDNYITTADADEAAHTVIASQLINETFAHNAGMGDELIGFGHSFEIDPAREDTLLREFAMAMMVRELFPRSPIKYMPPTKHKEGDIFFSHAYDVMSDLVAISTRQGIQLLGMMTEAMHNPFLMDRYVALKAAAYVYRAARHLGDEMSFKPDGIVARRQREVFDKALALLEEVAKDGMMAAMEKAGEDYSFFVVYGRTHMQLDYAAIEVPVVAHRKHAFDELNDVIERDVGRKIVVVGACIGTDSHTTGIDTILNMKGFAGDYGLERYRMFRAINLGSQVEPAALVAKAKEVVADAVLVSKVVTQREVHKEDARALIA